MSETPEMQVLRGMGVSAGIAIGRAVCIETRGPDVFRIPIAPEQADKEVARLYEGAEHARRELQRTRAKAGEDLGNDLAAIFDAHVLLLSDTHFLGRVEERIRNNQVNAEWAVHKTAEELDERFAHIDDTYLREKSEDLTDVSRHLLRSLQGIAHHDLSELPDDVVIVADDLTPSDAIRLGRARVIGFAIETGGRTSHTTIIARSLNLPAVAGLTGAIGLVGDQASIIVDGESGDRHPPPDARGRWTNTGSGRPSSSAGTRTCLASTRARLVDPRRRRDQADGQHRPARRGGRGGPVRRRRGSASTAASSSTSSAARTCRPRTSTSRPTAG